MHHLLFYICELNLLIFVLLHVAQEESNHVYSIAYNEKKISDPPNDQSCATGEQMEGLDALEDINITP